MPNYKILVADDEPSILEIMVRKIAAHGYKVISAKDGQEAWDKIQQENPDLILLDMLMPHMDGISVLSNLRATPPSKKWIPVIIISALGEQDTIKRALDMQADHYLTKPVSIDEIIKAIEQMIALIPLRNPEA